MALASSHIKGQLYLFSLNAMLGAFYATKARGLRVLSRFERIIKL